MAENILEGAFMVHHFTLFLSVALSAQLVLGIYLYNNAHEKG